MILNFLSAALKMLGIKNTPIVDDTGDRIHKSYRDVDDENNVGCSDGPYHTYKYRGSTEEREQVIKYRGVSSRDLLQRYGQLFFNETSGFGDQIERPDTSEFDNVRRELIRRGLFKEVQKTEKLVSDPGTLAVGGGEINRRDTHGR